MLVGAMYANNVSNLDQILSSLQCYVVRLCSLSLSAPRSASGSRWMLTKLHALAKRARAWRRVQPAAADPIAAAELRHFQ